MKFLEDLLMPISNMLERWTDSGLIWIILIGIVLAVLYMIFFR